jgi:predicted nucleotidyltransferase
MAVYGGIDLVLELPFCYATGSAGDFAMGAVSILNSLNSVDFLCFGAETDDLNFFDRISDIILAEDSTYVSLLKDSLKQGNSYAKARASAISGILQGSSDYDNLDSFLNRPNNILALEYMCALKKSSSSIKPVIIKRVQADYNDKTLYNSISSASAIRTALSSPAHFSCTCATQNNLDCQKKSDSFLDISLDVPESTLKIINKLHNTASPVYADDLSTFLIAKLMSRSVVMAENGPFGDFSDICDINEDISNKLNKISYPTDYAAITKNLCNRQYTSTRISRAMLHLILGYTDQNRKLFFENGYAFYANILGMKKENSAGLKLIKKASHIPLVTKKADFKKNIYEYENICSEVAEQMWMLDIMATRLYNQLVFNRYGTVLNDDFNIQLPIL